MNAFNLSVLVNKPMLVDLDTSWSMLVFIKRSVL